MIAGTDRHQIIYKFLDGQASTAEREELDQWINSSDDNRLEFNDIKLLFDNKVETGSGSDLHNDLDGSFVAIRDIIDLRIRRARAIRFGIRILLFAACLSVVYLISYLISRTYPF